MKKLQTLVMVVMVVFISLQTSAQAFDKGTKLITISIGGANMFHVPIANNSDGYGTGYFYNGWYSPITGEISVQGEFAVHKYVGVGFNVGLGGRGSNYGIGSGFYYSGFRSEFNVAFGAVGNFHFFQLIADKTGKNIHADKLDVYVGLNMGSGVAIHPANSNYGWNTDFDALFFIGPQVGVHYYFTDKIGINGELGYGKTFASAGITFKLGGSSTKSSRK